MSASISVIIPTLNEAQRIGDTIAAVRARLPGAEIIVADGGSTDTTAEIADYAGVMVVQCSSGRGPQCRAGAALATSDVLFFLHADTTLPIDAARVLREAFAQPQVKIGTFRLRFDVDTWFLHLCAWFTRIDSVFTRFGDQGIVVRRDFYQQLDGFPSWPLFEDVELLRRARRRTRVWSFPAAVTTSARRFHRRGPLRQQWQNAGLLLRFLCGASAQSLAAEYRPEPAMRQLAHTP